MDLHHRTKQGAYLPREMTKIGSSWCGRGRRGACWWMVEVQGELRQSQLPVMQLCLFRICSNPLPHYKSARVRDKVMR